MLAFLTRFIMSRMGLIHLLCPGIQQRINGLMVDILMASALMAIQFSILAQFWLPITLSLVLNTLFTLTMSYFFAKRAPNYGPERFATAFGLTTGTVASGLMLLRIIDPDYRTPIAMEFATALIYSIFIQAPMLFGVLVLLPDSSLFPWITGAVFGVLLFGSLVVGKCIRAPQW
jgi:ESS family glutamate:Na+ symporter